jgi:hypothetical protein
MHTTTLQEVLICKQTIKSNEERIAAINRRAAEIGKSAKTMNLQQCMKTKAEIAELRKETKALLKAIDGMKAIVKKFYAPATAA